MASMALRDDMRCISSVAIGGEATGDQRLFARKLPAFDSPLRAALRAGTLDSNPSQPR
jgi:hypothetical protein